MCKYFSISQRKINFLLFFFSKPVPVPLDERYLDHTRPSKFYSYTSVKFNSVSFFPYVLKRQFTEIDFIAYTGGAFGLFLGISITSFVEFFYYFTIRLAFGWLRRTPDVDKIESESNDSPESTQRSNFRYLVAYFSSSTIHGMNQIVMDRRHFVER